MMGETACWLLFFVKGGMSLVIRRDAAGGALGGEYLKVKILMSKVLIGCRCFLGWLTLSCSDPHRSHAMPGQASSEFQLPPCMISRAAIGGGKTAGNSELPIKHIT